MISVILKRFLLMKRQVKEALIMPTEDSNRQDNSETHWPTSFNEDEATLSRTSFAGIRFAEMKQNSSVSDPARIEKAKQDQHLGDKPLSNVDAAANVVRKNRLFTYIDLHGHASKRGISHSHTLKRNLKKLHVNPKKEFEKLLKRTISLNETILIQVYSSTGIISKTPINKRNASYSLN